MIAQLKEQWTSFYHYGLVANKVSCWWARKYFYHFVKLVIFFEKGRKWCGKYFEACKSYRSNIYSKSSRHFTDEITKTSSKNVSKRFILLAQLLSFLNCFSSRKFQNSISMFCFFTINFSLPIPLLDSFSYWTIHLTQLCDFFFSTFSSISFISLLTFQCFKLLLRISEYDWKLRATNADFIIFLRTERLLSFPFVSCSLFVYEWFTLDLWLTSFQASDFSLQLSLDTVGKYF